MKAKKYTITITVEVLDPAAAFPMFAKAQGLIDNECQNGHLSMDDGDCVTWKSESKDVEI
jgi:hypothetical protein